MFAGTKYFIIDMDGTFYLGDTLIPGADDALREIERSGRGYYFYTNNSSNSLETCTERLRHIGFPTPREKVLMSSYVAAEHILHHHPGKTVYLLGNGNLRNVMLETGVPLVEDDPDIVLLGFDTELTYQRIWDACRFLANGALYYATHPDVNCPVVGGFKPDTGAMIEMFAASTGRRPVVLGKPMQPTVDYLMRTLHCRSDELAFIGDRLETDIRIGTDRGIPTILVMTGATDDAILAASAIRPMLVLPSIAQLPQYLS